MSPEDVQKLRKELACTARELAVTLGLEPKQIAAWESGEEFPTKRHVEALQRLREKGASAVARQPRGKAAAISGLARLSDPALWKLVRKLLEHPALFEQTLKLSEKFPDPPDR